MATGDVVISSEQWQDLMEDIRFLAALQAAGVDNWEGYETACQLYNGEITEDDI